MPVKDTSTGHNHVKGNSIAQRNPLFVFYDKLTSSPLEGYQHPLQQLLEMFQ